MSFTPAFQCMRCAGYFQAAAGARSRVQCPHCEWIAAAGEFRTVEAAELAAGAATTGTVGAAVPSASGEGGDWVRKGKHLQFSCPHCQRPMRMLNEEAGGLTDCPHCGLEIVSPDPGSGSAARLSDASRRNLGGLASFKPGKLGAGGMRAPQRRRDQPAFPEHVEPPAEAEEIPQAVSPFGAQTIEPKTERAAPVRMLGLAELGASFQARDELQGEEGPRWESGGELGEDRVFNQRRGRLFAIIGGIALLGVGGLFVMLEFRRNKEAGLDAQQKVEQQRASSEAIQSRFQNAFETAKAFTGSDDWRTVLPLIRSRERLEPVMAKYYESRPFETVSLTSFEDPRDVPMDDLRYVQLIGIDEQGRQRVVGLEENENGEFLFDWELWVNIAHVQWQEFVTERPSSPQALRVTLARSSALDRLATDAGIPKDQARALRVWLDDSVDPHFAILRVGDPHDEELWEGTSWELGRRVVAELSFPPDAQESERVQLHRIVQPRWVRP